MAKEKREAAAEAPKEPTFDERLERLEAIVGELEQGQLGLEGSIARYREGVTLLAQCKSLLEGYRKQVEELSAGDAPGLKPYAGDPDLD
jgi:exodeoxyribonuclease VII small subunit